MNFEALMIILVASSLVKILTTLSIFQYGLGLKNVAFSIVVLLISFVLTLFVMQPVWDRVGGWAYQNYNEQQVKDLKAELEPFITKHTDAESLVSLQALAKKHQPKSEQVAESWSVKLAAFMLTELREAFYIGLLLIIPFLFIDLLVVNILMSLNITQLSALTVALPFKLLVFYVFNGWQLLTEKLLSFYL